MSRDEIEAKVREVLQTVLGHQIPPRHDARRGDEPGWDSLAHVNLVFSIESELGIQFEADELGELDSVAKLVDAAGAHLRAGT